MNYTRFIISVFVVFGFVFAYEFFYHGILLMDLYEETAFLWRSQQDIQELLPWTIAVQLAFSFLLTLLYSYYPSEQNLGYGLRFGLLTGLLLGTMQAGIYAYMPITFLLAWLWFSGMVFECLTIGAILGLLYKRKA